MEYRRKGGGTVAYGRQVEKGIRQDQSEHDKKSTTIAPVCDNL